MYTRILIPLDGSELAEQALPDAIGLARRSQAPLHLVRVVDLTQWDRTGLSSAGLRLAAVRGLVEAEAARATSELEQTAMTLRAKGLTVTTEVRCGAVVAELQRIAMPGDLFVIASHGRGGAVRWLLGSVAEELVRHSVVPVLFVRTLVPSRVEQEVRVAAPVPVAAPGVA